MRIALLLALILACASSAEPPLAATPLQWPAGRASLATGITRLTAGGNQVWLADGVDDAREADLPAVDATWWDGVIALCRAFNLRPDDGDPSDEQLEMPGTAVPIGHGTLVLSPGQPPGMRAVGGLLACAEADGLVRLWLRAEPRVGRGVLAWARADVPSLSPGNKPELEMIDRNDNSASLAASWRPSAPLPESAQLRLTIQAATVTRWTARGTLNVGVTVQMPVNAQSVKAVLLVDPAVTTWEGQTLPERRPLIAVTGPTTLLQRAQMRLRQGEAELATRGGGARSDEANGTVMYRFLRAAPEGAVELELEGRVVEAPQRLALDLPLPTALRTDDAAPLEAPTRLNWDAGQRPLAQWLGLLAASGNPVLPEVGVDTTAPITLAAMRGGFWDGILAISAVTGLAPAATPTTAFSGGAVRLISRQPLATAVCGPLLIEARRVGAAAGMIAVRLRAALEPRLPEDGFAPPEFRWASWANDEQGRMHQLVVDSPDSPSPSLRPGNVESDPGPLVVVRLAASGARRLTINGLVTLPRVHVWKGSLELAVNQPGELLLGTRAIELIALDAPTRIGSNQWGPGLLIRGLSGAASVRFSLTTAEGQAVAAQGEANRSGGGAYSRIWAGWCRIPAQGRVTADIVARAALPPLVLPVQLTLPVPDGL